MFLFVMKIREFQKLLRERKIDFALFYNIDSMGHDKDILYFSGYKGVGALVVPKNKRAFLAVPVAEYGRVKKGRIKVYRLAKKKRLFESCLGLINKNKINKKKIGVNKDVFTLNIYKAFKKYLKKNKVVDVSRLCEKAREKKTEDEIKKIKKACKINDKIFNSLVKKVKSKKLKTELGVVGFIEKESKKFGCELAFDPVVASGKGASVPHYEAENIKLRKGFCVIDFGVKFKDYSSDMTRTIYIGKPSKNDKDLYDFLLGIQKDIINNLKIDDNCGKIYDSVKMRLKKYSRNFTHGLGHGIGIKVHELPSLTDKSKDKIQRNTVFTVEPGIYFKNKLGIRIEDTVLMKDNAIVLTRSTKDLLTV